MIGLINTQGWDTIIYRIRILLRSRGGLSSFELVTLIPLDETCDQGTRDVNMVDLVFIPFTVDEEGSKQRTRSREETVKQTTLPLS